MAALRHYYSLTEEWKEKLDQNHVIGAATLDLSKAFHCIPHDLLLEKLRFYRGTRETIGDLNRSLRSRYFASVKNERTTEFCVVSARI